MCGIAGLLNRNALESGAHDNLIAMRDTLAHRGPDEAGIWLDREAGIGLTHRRLSIVELSQAGHQPMHSQNGRYVLSFNGEIYNFKNLKKEIESENENLKWKGQSDTEVLLALIESFGLDRALKRCRGMFALALWDRKNRILSIARDPMGEKPLYVATHNNCILFGSELKAITKYPDFNAEINRESLTLCLRHGYIPAPNTLYQGIEKIYPGEIVEISSSRIQPEFWKRHFFWSTINEAIKGRKKRFTGTADDAVSKLEFLIRQSVKQQSIADVPLGAFLSGGIDSSTIVALMQSELNSNVETFSLGFEENGANEAEHAKAIAKHLGTKHRETYLTSKDALSLVTKMPAVYDEPFTDNSQLPTYLLSQFARKHVTVAITGDAGDELFGGYRRYKSFAKRSNKRGIENFLQKCANQILRQTNELLATDRTASKLIVANRLRQLESPDALYGYERYFTLFDSAHMLVNGANEVVNSRLSEIQKTQNWSLLDKMTFLDLTHYLPDNILVKVDRAAMTHSLETRIPLLDPEIIRFSFSLPDDIRSLNGKGKGILRKVLKRHVPQELWDRPKQGFSIPTNEWLLGEFSEIANDLFSPTRLSRLGIMNEKAVNACWTQFKNGNRKFGPIVWALFMTQLYLK